MSDTRETPTPLSGRIIGISLAAAMGGFLFGFDTAVINGAIDAMSEDFGISGFLQGFAVSSALLGCVLGAWFAGPLARSEEHTSELQSRGHLVCRLLLEKNNTRGR